MSNFEGLTVEELYDIVVAANVELQKLLSLLLTIYADVDALTNPTIPGKNALYALLKSNFNYLKNDVVKSYVAGKLYTSQDRIDILPDVDAKKLDSSLLLDILIKYFLTSYREGFCENCNDECCSDHDHGLEECNKCRANGNTQTNKCWHKCRSCKKTAKECQKSICCISCKTCIPCNKIKFSDDVNYALAANFFLPEHFSLTCPWYVIIRSLEIAKHFRNLFGHVTIQDCNQFLEVGWILDENFKEIKVPDHLESYITFVFSNIVKHTKVKLSELPYSSAELENEVDQTMGNLENIFSLNVNQYLTDVAKLKNIFEEDNNKFYERLDRLNKFNVIHEVTYDGKDWSYIDVYNLLDNKDYATFRKLFNHNRHIVNNLCNDDNDTFLMRASMSDDLHVVEHLLEHFSDVINIRAVGEHGWNAYHWAATYDNVDVMMVLLSFDRTRLDDQSNNGDTPLHCAAMNDSRRMIELLLDARAGVDVLNNYGDAPDRYARADDVKKMIRDHRKKTGRERSSSRGTYRGSNACQPRGCRERFHGRGGRSGK